jgi:hypothetical protein
MRTRICIGTSSPKLLANASMLYCLKGSQFFSLLLAILGLACTNPTSLAHLSITSDAVPNGILPLLPDSSGEPTAGAPLLLTRALPVVAVPHCCL